MQSSLDAGLLSLLLFFSSVTVTRWKAIRKGPPQNLLRGNKPECGADETAERSEGGGGVAVPRTTPLRKNNRPRRSPRNKKSERSEEASTIDYEVLRYESIGEELLAECSTLFGEHYGVWGPNGYNPGKRVRLSPGRLKNQCLFDKNCFIVLARKRDEKNDGRRLVGHAFVRRFPWGDHGGFASWITQLVVATDERGRGIGTRLCNRAFNHPRDDDSSVACGLVSSHPYAVRALERATDIRCSPTLISKHAAGLIAASGIPYVRDCPIQLDDKGSTINTNFFVDHAEVNALLAKEKDWQMGPLNDGEEFFAFVFKD